jgi:hypothetical protein
MSTAAGRDPPKYTPYEHRETIMTMAEELALSTSCQTSFCLLMRSTGSKSYTSR